MKRVVSTDEHAISLAKQVLEAGKLLIFPTDTVYGIAANATNQQAVDALLAYKGNRKHKAISIAVRDQAMAETYVIVNEAAKRLYQLYMPGPISIVSLLKQPTQLAKGCPSLQGTQSVRVIPHHFVEKLMEVIDFPITATSANISNAGNIRSYAEFLDKTPVNKQELLELFIDDGELAYAEPSTVIDTSKEDVEIVRQGPIAVNAANMLLQLSSKSASDTKNAAKEVLQILKPNKLTVLLLQGNLGAGKTTFTQGLAQNLGVTETVRSPSYTLVKEYPLDSSQELEYLYHIDAWRLHQAEEIQDLGLASILSRKALLVIEWPQRLAQQMHTLFAGHPLYVLHIQATGDTSRNLQLEQII